MLAPPYSIQTRLIVRNGIPFQVPLSNHSSCRYSVHAAGDGVGWSTVESLDVDQPHGLDFRQLNHIAIGVRKRIGHEHTAFADATVGGLHIPGGCAVLDVVDTTGDVSDGWGDGTYVGGGLVWASAELLWLCGTNDGTYDAVADATLLKLHPDKQWGGQDVTWTGAHEFDASVDISGNVALDGDFTVDGTAVFDATGIQFGGGAGIGLFYDPTVYASAESITLPNGMVLKHGIEPYVANSTVTITFAPSFPNTADNAQISVSHSAVGLAWPVISNLSKTQLQVKTSTGAATSIHWFAIGR